MFLMQDEAIRKIRKAKFLSFHMAIGDEVEQGGFD